MKAVLEELTTSEVAVATATSIQKVSRTIDEKILPSGLYSAKGTRTFRRDACVLIAFYFETANSLTAPARLRVIRNAVAHCPTWEDLRECAVAEGPVTVQFAATWDAVNDRLKKLKKAREMVVADPQILSGTPVFKGTRVPVYDIAAAVNSGASKETILASYPSLKAWQVELAPLYAKAVPARGRPRRPSLPRGVAITVKKRKLRSSSAQGGAGAEVSHR